MTDELMKVAAFAIAKTLRDWAADESHVQHPALRDHLSKAAGWIEGLATRAAPAGEPAPGYVLVREEAIRQARMMANLCFNLSQSSALDERTRKSMKECQTEFDRAMLAAAVDKRGSER